MPEESKSTLFAIILLKASYVIVIAVRKFEIKQKNLSHPEHSISKMESFMIRKRLYRNISNVPLRKRTSLNLKSFMGGITTLLN